MYIANITLAVYICVLIDLVSRKFLKYNTRNVYNVDPFKHNIIFIGKCAPISGGRLAGQSNYTRTKKASRQVGSKILCMFLVRLLKYSFCGNSMIVFVICAVCVKCCLNQIYFIHFMVLVHLEIIVNVIIYQGGSEMCRRFRVTETILALSTEPPGTQI